MKQITFFLFLSLFFSSCFSGLDTRGSVRSYKNGVVKTVGGQFYVGDLPSHWKRQPISSRTILLKHPQGSSISIGSWCKGAFDDGSLDDLTSELTGALAYSKTLSREVWKVHGQNVLIKRVAGKLDGKSVYLKTAVSKMNSCVFDFAFVSSQVSPVTEAEFDSLVRGFRYHKGPSSL